MRTTGAEAALFLLAAVLAAVVVGSGHAALAAPARAPAETLTLAVTVDDLPATPATDLAEMRRITKGMLAALKKQRVEAVGFVNESRLEPAAERRQRVELLRQWIEAGHELGNHTYSHADLQAMPLAAYEREVMRGEEETRRLQAERGHGVRFFRHPYTHTGPTLETRAAFEAFLVAHGYATAPFSIETSDYVFDRLRRRALARGDSAGVARLRAAYLDHALAVAGFMEGLARDTFGRAVPQILLVHANGTNAEALDELLARLSARGYRFVPLDEALADEAWGTPDRYVGPNGPSWLHRFQIAKGRPMQVEQEPDPPKWVLDEYQAAQEKQP
jgi:peptidoglycan/xylan/chitin deacetylase (PgdA/CDA1 family)